MSQQTTLKAFDGHSTPKLHTFEGDSTARLSDKETIALYKEGVESVPDEAQGRVSIKRTTLGSGINRVSLRVTLPVMEAVSGTGNAQGYTAPPKVAHVLTVEAIGLFHPRSTISDRRLIRQLLVNLMEGTEESSTPLTTGPSVELFDHLVVPT